MSSGQIMSVQAANEAYPTRKSHWSFTISTTLDKPLHEVTAKLAGIDNFESLSRLNPVCVEYEESKRDWVVVPEGTDLGEARVRELPSALEESDASDSVGGKRYRRVQFTTADKISMFFGLFSDVQRARGTYVWDEETKTGLLEIVNTSKPGVDIWLRKVIRFVEGGERRTKVEEFVEGYCPGPLPIFETIARSFAKSIHKNWMAKYPAVFGV